MTAAGYSKVDPNTLSYYQNNKLYNNVHFSINLINETDIYTNLREIKSSAYGTDNINIKMLNLVLPHCITHIKNIFNSSIISGKFPCAWKSANILPISKVLTPGSFGDLRPISILPAISKLFEKIIYKQILEFLEANNILPMVQSGFRAKHGASTALLKIVDDLSHAMDGSKCTMLVLLDQSKAFDSVNFQLLLAKLRFIGCDTAALSWFEDYLNDRTQRVKLNSLELSNFSVTTNGVPQGSILGPLLFLLYTFDLPSAIHKCQMHMYADDVQIYLETAIEDAGDSVTILNRDLAAYETWCSNHGLLINSNKTHALCVGNARSRNFIVSNFDLSIGGTLIQWVDVAKNLGVYLDSGLTFEHHCNKVYKQAMFKLKSMYNLKFLLDEATKLHLIKALIYPHLDYCSQIYYSFLTNYNQAKIQRVQNASVRFVCDLQYREHVTPHLIKLNEPRLSLRFQYLYIMLLYKVYTYKVPPYLYNLLIKRSEIHSRDIRLNTFTVPRHSSSKFKCSFSYKAPLLLNPILDILDSPFSRFKFEIKNRLFAN